MARESTFVRLVHSIPQLLRYTTVGVTATILYLSLTNVLQQRARLTAPIAASLAFIPVVAANYALHYRWTFRAERPHTSAIPRFIGTSLGGLAINYAVVQCGTHWFEAPKTAILLLAVVLVILWNYALSRLWVFVNRA